MNSMLEHHIFDSFAHKNQSFSNTQMQNLNEYLYNINLRLTSII
jgi:hypothetical protein